MIASANPEKVLSPCVLALVVPIAVQDRCPGCPSRQSLGEPADVTVDLCLGTVRGAQGCRSAADAGRVRP